MDANKAIREQVALLAEHLLCEDLDLPFVAAHARYLADLAAYKHEHAATEVLNRIKPRSAMALKG